MNIDLQSGLLDVAEYIESHNCDDRPDSEDISLIVIHNISLPPGEFGGNGVIQLFTNCLDPDEHPYYREIHELCVSSHLLIRRDGEVIQFVPFHKRAWHAGQSSYCGREKCNDFSIGIELEGTDETEFDDRQYEKLNQILAQLDATYSSVNMNDITGHSDIAPGRKTDPGPMFDWQRIGVIR